MAEMIIEKDDTVFYVTEPKDLEEIIEIEKVQYDSENRRFVYLWPMERHLESIDCKDELHMTIKHKETQEVIGYVILSGLTEEHDVIEFDRIALKIQGKGYGRKSVQLIKSLCFEKLGCNRLWLDVFDYNTKAFELYKSEDFIHEGTLRQCKKYNGKYHAMHLMSMLREEYFA
ncbi:GNAT family N-acetyltransferase [Alkaliphilus metalliredigens]|nr:GNAT family protein [Alkaliphilus metalliredigens]